MSYDYDLFVIGGGSGGVRAARLAASEAGAKTALAEEYRMGGTCVIRGCVPKKLMLYASRFPALAEEAAAYGWSLKKGEFNWPHFQRRLRAELERLEKAYRTTLQNAGVTIFDKSARLGGPNKVILGDAQKITARHILIATGGHPSKPNIVGAELAITSNQIFNLPELPKSILIVGGGYIACEFAFILKGLGVDVSLIYRGKQILRGFDSEVAALLSEQFRAQGINLRTGINATKITKSNNGFEVDLTTGGCELFEHVFFATGRTPNTDALSLEQAGLGVGSRGEMLVDAFSKTATPSIFAIGDVTNRLALTPVAIREGAAFVDTVFHNKPQAFNHALVASAVFTRPEIGSIGVSEEVAAAQEPIEVYKTQFKPMRQAFAGGDDFVFMKLIISRASRKVLGCHIMSDYSAEMIQLAAVAITMGATKEQFDQTCAVHPTLAEELVTMKTPTRIT